MNVLKENEDPGKAMPVSLDEVSPEPERPYSHEENMEQDREVEEKAEHEEMIVEEKNEDEEEATKKDEDEEEEEDEGTESEDDENNEQKAGKGQPPGEIFHPKLAEISDNDEASLEEASNDDSYLDASLQSRDDHITRQREFSMTVDQESPVDDGNRSLRPDAELAHHGIFDAKDLPKSEKNLGDNTFTGSPQVSGVPHVSAPTMKVENVEEGMNKDANIKEESVAVENRNSGQAFIFEADSSEGWDSGTEEEQITFMQELEHFCRMRGSDFKPPKFYGEPLNLLKLWNATIKLGGYEKVTSCKLWRIVGESFRPPKTCTTVSWTFRIFYEKALLDYERHKARNGELSIPVSLSDSNIENQAANNQASGSGRARRDAAARAMQGWHSQRVLGNGEVSDPIIKDKSSMSLQKREKQLKNLGLLKRKKPSTLEAPVKVPRTKVTKLQLDTTVIDLGPPADWVKINVRVTKDCYEVYALVPGLLREEVRVQSDPAGRLVVTGEPDNVDNPWGVTSFKKVVNLPSRIDPHQTSAVVTLHGQLFVRVPFEQSD